MLWKFWKYIGAITNVWRAKPAALTAASTRAFPVKCTTLRRSPVSFSLSGSVDQIRCSTPAARAACTAALPISVSRGIWAGSQKLVTTKAPCAPASAERRLLGSSRSAWTTSTPRTANARPGCVAGRIAAGNTHRELARTQERVHNATALLTRTAENRYDLLGHHRLLVSCVVRTTTFAVAACRGQPSRLAPAFLQCAHELGDRFAPAMSCAAENGSRHRDQGLRTGSGTNLLQDFPDSGIFRRQASIHRNIFGRALLKKNQGVADVVGLIDGSGNLRDHFFFLAAIPMPGGASIRQTGTIPSFHADVLPLAPIAAQRMGAVRYAIWTARSRVHSWVSLCGSSRSVRHLALLLTWVGRSAFLTAIACCDHVAPQIFGEDNRPYDGARQ